MIKNRKIVIFLLFTIFLIGAILRFYKLPLHPVGFQIDEASKGYSAYSLLKTGRDDNNNFLPLSIDMFGDNSPAGYHYLAVLPVKIFGLTEFAVRFPGALFGAFTVIATYFLAYSIFQSKKVGLTSAMLLSISPWHINLSRASSESLVSLFFIVSGFSLLIWSIRKQSIGHILIGSGTLAISFFFYQTPRLFVPLLFFMILIFCTKIWKLKLRSSYLKTLIFSFLVLSSLVFVLFFIVPGGTGRFSQVNIFNFPETKLVLEEQIREEGISGTTIYVTRLLHNKVINYSLTYLSNYFEYFSWKFLFIGSLPPLYSVPNMGVIYLIELPFIIYGIFSLIYHKDKIYKIPLLWLVISPMAGAIAVDVNNLQRALVLYLILEIIAAYGLVHIFTDDVKHKKLVLLFAVALLFLFNFYYFLHQYFILAKVHRPWYRNNGFSQMMQLINKDYGNYDQIITTKSRGGYPLFQFFSKYDPYKYQAEGSKKDEDFKGFGKFIFSPENCPFDSNNPLLSKRGKIIFIEDGNCAETRNLYKVPYVYILREDKTKAFRVVYVQDDEIFNAE